MIKRILLKLIGINVNARLEWGRKLKNEFSTCGENVVMRFRSNFTHPKNTNIGENVWIGENGWFQGIGGISIGNNVIISRNCTIFSGYHDYNAELLPYDNHDVKKPVIIEDNVWIGMNVNIIPGVKIGEGAIIGMGTTITHDVPPLAIVGSVAHRVIKYRDESHYFTLKNQLKFRDVKRNE
ncbi:MAG: acyltransferase [Bacteroidota bacterium]